MNKGFTVYVSPLEMDSTAHRLVELPMEQEKLDALQLELNTGSPLYTEVSDFCGREYLEEHLPEDMDLTELNLLAEKLASLEPVQEAAFEGLVRMELDKGMTELPLCRLVDLANSADCCHAFQPLFQPIMFRFAHLHPLQKRGKAVFHGLITSICGPQWDCE